MTAPRRLLESQARLPEPLLRALRAAPSEPGPGDLEELARKLGSALGVPPPAVAPAASVVSGPATVALSTTKPFFALGAWVLGGVAVGVGLSSVAAFTVSMLGSPTQLAATSSTVLSSAPPPLTQAPAQLPGVASMVGDASNPASPKAERSGSVAAAQGLPAAPPAAPEPVALEPRETELSLLRRAQEAIATDPGRALALSALHGRAFPQGLLAQEREVIAIDALTRLGHAEPARLRARDFVERYPGSAHVPRLRALLAEHKTR